MVKSTVVGYEIKRPASSIKNKIVRMWDFMQKHSKKQDSVDLNGLNQPILQERSSS